jgi:small redox-active disulfide protein 2
MMIEVFGPGCPKCHATERNVRKALQELGLKEGEDVMINMIKDPRVMAARGVFMTPGLVIDGVKVSVGRIPGPEEIKNWIKERE